MHILGVPADVDPRTVRPTSDWALSARSEREHRRRDDMRDNARAAFDCLTDRELQVKVAVDLAEQLQEMGGGDPPPGFPNAAKMARDKMLDYLADRTVSFVPEIEVIYPGAIDPTV